MDRILGSMSMLLVDLHWLAGLLEGEGSFIVGPPSARNQPRISISMTDEDVILRVAKLFGVAHVHGRRATGKAHWKPAFQVQLRGRRGVELMRELRPLMGERRREQIDRAVASYVETNRGSNCRKLTENQVIEARKRRQKGETILRLAAEYGVARNTLRKAINGTTWRPVGNVGRRKER